MQLLKQSFLCAIPLLLLTGGCTTHKAPPATAAATSDSEAKKKDNGGSLPKAATLAAGQEVALFDGKTLTGWVSADFSGRGSVTVSNSQINLGNGYMTGITWTGAVPRMDYEISLEAKRVEGSDFFCGLTFPVDTNYLSFIVGGWGGGVVGISSIDGEDASQNETTKYMNFTNGQWYKVRVRVAGKKVQAWIDGEEMANVDIEDKRLSIRIEVEASTPLGIATWNTGAAVRNIMLKKL